MTSPPYWGLRDYGHGPEQLGFEPKVADYIANLVAIFEESRRILRPDGTLWVVIGDTYNTRTKIRPSAHNPGLGDEHKARDTFKDTSWKKASADGYARHSARAGSNLKEKDLSMVPARFAIAMVDSGWYLRSEIIWDKPSTTPENAKDRPSRTHESIFLFSKSDRYKFHKFKSDSGIVADDARRSVWRINTGSRGSTGPAVFPELLAERCILASTDPDDLVVDPFVGSGTTVQTALLHGRRAVGTDLTTEWFPTLTSSEELA